MERELLLLVLASATFATVAWLVGIACDRVAPTFADDERRAWWTTLAPLLGGVFAGVFWLGWALQEPDPADEHAQWPVIVLAACAMVVVIRAFARALVSMRGAMHACAPIGTIGLVRPRVVVSEAYRETVEPELLAAALAHERAHARARDPLRILASQLATDVQWPLPGARRRHELWLVALELRRDDEAVRDGADPRDLAAAIVAAARWCRGARRTATAQLHGGGAELETRVRRLVGDAPMPSSATGRRERSGLVACALLGAFVGTLALGIAFGEDVVRRLPGVGFESAAHD